MEEETDCKEDERDDYNNCIFTATASGKLNHPIGASATGEIYMSSSSSSIIEFENAIFFENKKIIKVHEESNIDNDDDFAYCDEELKSYLFMKMKSRKSKSRFFSCSQADPVTQFSHKYMKCLR
jgi:hypothetical protein